MQTTVNYNAIDDYRIDDTLVSPQTDTITREDIDHKMAPRAIQLLGYLVEHAGRPITYNEVNDTIWSGGCSENSFYQQIASLRKALGDSSSNPRYIKTIPKQGYMFIAADVVERKSAEPDTSELLHAQANKPQGSLTWPLLGFAVLAVISIITATIWPATSARDPLFEWSQSLSMPEKITVIEWQKKPSVRLQSTMNALALLSEYHSAKNDSSHHVSLIHRFPQSALTDNESFYQKLDEHFNNGIANIYRPEAELTEQGWTLSLTEVDPTTHISKTLFEITSSDQELPLALYRFEEQLEKMMGDESSNSPIVMSTNPSANQWFLQSVQYLFNPDKTRTDLQSSIRFSQKAIDANPLNLLAYSILWSETIKLVNVHSDFDINRIFDQMDASLKKIKSVAPTYHRALLAKADLHCWIEEDEKCSDGVLSALEADPYSAESLDALFWLIEERPELQTLVANFNYTLNPFYHDAFANYRDALFAVGDLHSISELTDEHSRWSDGSDWFVQAQRSTNIDLLHHQAEYYRNNYLHREDIQEAEGQLLPSRYLGYSLLNANRPDLANFWARHGREHDLPYFDLRVIELLSNLWEGNWQPLSWQVERTYVMERKDFQNSLDKLTIAYFDLYTEWMRKAAEGLRELHPQLLEEHPTIDEGNLRLYVYYSEIQKRNGNLKYTSRTNALINNYLNKHPSIERSSDFGIADIEFYALNAQPEKALDNLENAVYKQGWLPNSLWLWPPIEHNHFLKSIRKEPRFKKIQAHIHNKLKDICFERECPSDSTQNSTIQ